MIEDIFRFWFFLINIVLYQFWTFFADVDEKKFQNTKETKSADDNNPGSNFWRFVVNFFFDFETWALYLLLEDSVTNFKRI